MKRLAAVLLSFFAVVILTANQCKKDKPKPDNPYGLPDATQTGAMTFACLINGEPYSAKRNTLEIGGGVSNDSLYAFGRNSTTSKVYFQSLYLKIKKDLTIGLLIPLDDENNYFQVSADHDCQGALMPVYQYRGKGQVEFTRLDTVNKIMSGIFNGIIPVPGCDTLKLTEGRFDLRYYN